MKTWYPLHCSELFCLWIWRWTRIECLLAICEWYAPWLKLCTTYLSPLCMFGPLGGVNKRSRVKGWKLRIRLWKLLACVQTKSVRNRKESGKERRWIWDWPTPGPALFPSLIHTPESHWPKTQPHSALSHDCQEKPLVHKLKSPQVNRTWFISSPGFPWNLNF